MNRAALPTALCVALAAGCTPQNATITSGKYTAFLASSTSPTLFGSKLNLDGFADEPQGANYQLDCREEPTLDNDANCDALGVPQHESWMLFDGFEVVEAELQPWRGEAIMTAEGDLQVTFHQSLPGGEDFRFVFVVDPDFQPTVCTSDDSGQPTRIPLDGDWVANWTAGDPEGLEGFSTPSEGSMFYLNSGSYQFNPSNMEQVWILPEEWLGGFATAKFSAEEMFLRSTRFGRPSAYASYELDSNPPTAADMFYTALEPGVDPTTAGAYQTLIDQVELIAQENVAEFQPLGMTLRPRIHTNEWRAPDGNSPGLDGWVELHYNWVRFDQDREDLVVGEPASGEFSLSFGSRNSQSRVFLNGEFEIDKIKKDKWTVPDLQQQKLEEYGTALCGDAPAAGN